MFVSSCVLVFGTVSLHATTITFSGLNGANLTPFTIDTEGGFTVIPSLGNWSQGQVYGNPAPSILDGPVFNPGRGTIAVTDGGGLFTFSSLDYSSNNGTSKYVIEGLLGTTVKYTLTDTLTASTGPDFGFTTLLNRDSTAISTLLVDVTPGPAATSINIDNINVSAVPEPSNLLFLALTAGFVVLKRSRLLNCLIEKVI